MPKDGVALSTARGTEGDDATVVPFGHAVEDRAADEVVHCSLPRAAGQNCVEGVALELPAKAQDATKAVLNRFKSSPTSGLLVACQKLARLEFQVTKASFTWRSEWLQGCRDRNGPPGKPIQAVLQTWKHKKN